jgi:hypothetical protein
MTETAETAEAGTPAPCTVPDHYGCMATITGRNTSNLYRVLGMTEGGDYFLGGIDKYGRSRGAVQVKADQVRLFCQR